MMTSVICDKNRLAEQLLACQKQFLISGPTVCFNRSSFRTIFGLEVYSCPSHGNNSKKMIVSVYIP
jgi:hypothetical protein